VHAWQPEAESRNVVLRLDARDGLTLRIDRPKCQRVFDNLLKNAFEAVDHGPGEVSVHAALHASNQIRISVADSGAGVPEGLNVFALFESTKAEGTGLGLPICKQIVVAHGGGLDFARLTPHGTVFHVDLPVTGPSVAELR